MLNIKRISIIAMLLAMAIVVSVLESFEDFSDSLELLLDVLLVIESVVFNSKLVLLNSTLFEDSSLSLFLVLSSQPDKKIKKVNNKIKVNKNSFFITTS